MSETSHQIVEQVLRMPRTERAALIDELLARLYESPDPTVQAAWTEELARREQEDESSDVAWEELNAELEEKYGRK